MADSETHEEEPFQASSDSAREVSDADKELLAKQDSRTVTEFRAKKFQGEARKHWDLFYKRNETRYSYTFPSKKFGDSKCFVTL